MFDVKYLPRSNLVVSTLSGFLSIQDVACYAQKAEPIIHRAAARPGGYRILIDVSECVIQAQAVVSAFQEHVASVPQADRCAVVTGNSMVRMQVKRILAGFERFKAFEHYHDAHVWLCG